MTELDDRVAARVATAAATPRPDAALEHPLHGRAAPASGTFFEVAPLVASLRVAAGASRPLRAGDVALAERGERRTIAASARSTADADRRGQVASLDGARAQPRRVRCDARRRCSPTRPAHRHDAARRHRRLRRRLPRRCSRAPAGFGMPRSGWGVALAWRARAVRRSSSQRLAARRDRWDGRLDRVGRSSLAADDALPGGAPDEERLRAAPAGGAAASRPTLDPLPADAGRDLRAIVAAGATAFDGDARRALDGVADDRDAAARRGLLAEVAALLPLTAFDAEPVRPRAESRTRVARVRERPARPRAGAVRDELRRRIAAAGAQLTRTTPPPPARRGSTRSAAARGRCSARTCCSCPSSRLPPTRATSSAAGARRRGELLGRTSRPTRDATSRSTTGSPASRACATQMRALGAGRAAGRRSRAPSRSSCPCSCRTGRRPLAGARVPAGPTIDGDRLLYTAHYATRSPRPRRSAACCSTSGPRSMPGDGRETTGIAFHYDRPTASRRRRCCWSCPPALGGAWQWDDLVAALHETLDLARKRAVEPGHVDATPYAQLPAGDGHGGDAARGISIATDSRGQQRRRTSSWRRAMTELIVRRRRRRRRCASGGSRPSPCGTGSRAGRGRATSTARCGPRCATRCGC